MRIFVRVDYSWGHYRVGLGVLGPGPGLWGRAGGTRCPRSCLSSRAQTLDVPVSVASFRACLRFDANCARSAPHKDQLSSHRITARSGAVGQTPLENSNTLLRAAARRADCFIPEETCAFQSGEACSVRTGVTAGGQRYLHHHLHPHHHSDTSRSAPERLSAETSRTRPLAVGEGDHTLPPSIAPLQQRTDQAPGSRLPVAASRPDSPRRPRQVRRLRNHRTEPPAHGGWIDGLPRGEERP
ncbi:unnamed protein product [Pleuronectes platessa]|uniref:Uncharacterized protein n=1 Tax=Pleuronectes platessa TaxID=8262 RepID=A0A9N7TW60_PLEPL|nr:unnamed protein product [Pleuronectes platessa]